MRNVFDILVGNLTRGNHLGELDDRWEDNIKEGLK
jgi:hypothetical protein